jgi:hypothetical protein
MRPSEPGASTTPSSPRTGWWRAPWSGSGRRSCASWRGSSKTTTGGRREQPLVLSDDDRDALQALGQNLPHVWHAVSTTAADRKRILRFIIREVILDQTKLTGHVWLKIL